MVRAHFALANVTASRPRVLLTSFDLLEVLGTAAVSLYQGIEPRASPSVWRSLLIRRSSFVQSLHRCPCVDNVHCLSPMLIALIIDIWIRQQCLRRRRGNIRDQELLA